MSVVVKIEGLVHGTPSPYDGHFVAGEYTPEQYAFGELETTTDIAQARRFPSAVEAMDWWKQEHPQFMGGQNIGGINRPLTAFTISVFTPEATP